MGPREPRILECIPEVEPWEPWILKGILDVGPWKPRILKCILDMGAWEPRILKDILDVGPWEPRILTATIVKQRESRWAVASPLHWQRGHSTTDRPKKSRNNTLHLRFRLKFAHRVIMAVDSHGENFSLVRRFDFEIYPRAIFHLCSKPQHSSNVFSFFVH